MGQLFKKNQKTAGPFVAASLKNNQPVDVAMQMISEPEHCEFETVWGAILTQTYFAWKTFEGLATLFL